MNVRELSEKYEFPVYPKRGLVIVRGEGARVWDEQGREYIDCIGGFGVANLGHANPHVCEAIARQARLLITCPGTIDNPPRAQLWRRLAEIAPGGLTRSFLCNSGTEAVEAAIKFARLTTGRPGFVCAARGFHGRTLGALSATHKQEFRDPFKPLVPGFSHVPFNSTEKLVEAVNETTAGVILEVVQGEGGVHVATPEFLQTARRLCDERGSLLIIDEVQTGFCRTGRMFACQHFDLRPDILCLAKGIAGGLPMGAVLCSDRVAPAAGKHGSTCGGNPLCCAAALAAIEEYTERHLDQRAKHLGRLWLDRLRASDLGAVREIRGLGLIVGIELKQKAKPVLEALQANGVLALPAGTTVVRLLPPLVISEEDIHTVTARLIEVLG